MTQAIAERLGNKDDIRIFRYVYDYLVIVLAHKELTDIVAVDLMEVFAACSHGVRFTHERTLEGSLQFLDLKLMFLEDHICWAYEPRSKKDALPYDSAHSKLVKRGTAQSFLGAALAKSCHHEMGRSFLLQVDHLESVGFPRKPLTDAADSLKRKYRGVRLNARERQKNQTGYHSLRSRYLPQLKKCREALQCSGCFFGPEETLGLVQKDKCPGKASEECKKKHQTKFVDCKTSVVYDIPLFCGSSYVKPTGRCINDCAREHAATI